MLRVRRNLLRQFPPTARGRRAFPAIFCGNSVILPTVYHSLGDVLLERGMHFVDRRWTRSGHEMGWDVEFGGGIGAAVGPEKCLRTCDAKARPTGPWQTLAYVSQACLDYGTGLKGKGAKGRVPEWLRMVCWKSGLEAVSGGSDVWRNRLVPAIASVQLTAGHQPTQR